jgi:tetratricopeptide (TPR) repeat protein
VVTALTARIAILAAATPGKHPLQAEGKDEAGAVIRAPLAASEQAYAEAVATLAERFHADAHHTIRQSVADALYNLAIHQRERLHLDESLANYGLLLHFFAEDHHSEIEQAVASSYLNRAYVLTLLLDRHAEALADYDALLARFANASSAKMRDTLAKTAASRLSCLNRMLRKGIAVNYGDQYEDLTPEERDATIATVNRANAHSDAGEHRQAIEIYDQVLAERGESLHPEWRRQCLDVMVRKAYSLAQLQQREAALAVNEEVIARYGSDLSMTAEKDVALAMSNKAVNLRKLGRHDEELPVYGQIIERWQNSNVAYLRERVANALFNKASLLEELDTEQSLALYRRAANQYMDADHLSIRLEAVRSALNAAVLLRKKGRYAEAVKACEELIEVCNQETDLRLLPQRIKAQVCAARCYGSAGMPERAVVAYKQLLALPDDLVAAPLRRTLRNELHVLRPPHNSVLVTMSLALKRWLRRK